MIAFELPAHSVDDVVRVVRALGSHRYVAGRLHLVHAFVFAAAGGDGKTSALDAARTWAEGVLADESIDKDSRDERLLRRASDEELALALEAFWRPGAAGDGAQERLMELLVRHGLEVPRSTPFDETAEDDMHPVLVDAGWELLPLAQLDPERHKGAIQAFGEPIAFDVARFEEESAYEPISYLQELPALGAAELLRGADGEGLLASPLTVWAEGNETYHDYIVRGVIRAAKLQA